VLEFLIREAHNQGRGALFFQPAGNAMVPAAGLRDRLHAAGAARWALLNLGVFDGGVAADFY